MKTTLYFILLTFAILAFVPNSFALEDSPEYVVRAIYFYPNDIEPHPDIDATLDYFIKDYQKLFADKMEFHGYGRKTFRFEDDGNVMVHKIKGNFNDAYYNGSGNIYGKVFEEFRARFGYPKNIHLFVIDTRNPGVPSKPCGVGWGDSESGFAVVNAYANCSLDHQGFSDLYMAIRSFGLHELLHAFGMFHDVSQYNPLEITSCGAGWLDKHRYFNPGQNTLVNDNTSIQMLPPTPVPASTAIRLRFEVTDPDGLHQAELVSGDTANDPIIACEKLSGTNATVEFVTTDIFDVNAIRLRVMDAQGNFNYGGKRFPVDFTNLLPSPEAVSIPDPLLRNAIHSHLNLAPHETITQLNILNLWRLQIWDIENIKDLTGLEYASNLFHLWIDTRQVQDITPLTELKNLGKLSIFCTQAQIPPLAELENLRALSLGGAQILDISPLTQLKNLYKLTLAWNRSIQDITSLTQLKNLTHLGILGNPISDFTPLTEMTQLRWLNLNSTGLKDLQSLTTLTNLYDLFLSNNQISDLTPFAGLTNLRILGLQRNQISDVSPLTELVNLRELYLSGNPIEDFSPLRTLLANNPNLKIDIDIPDPSPLAFSPSTIADQTFIVGRTIQSLTLPKTVGGTTPYTYSISGLASGLQFAPATRELSGTPTTAETTTATYTAKDAASAFVSLTFTIEVTDGVILDVNGDGQVTVLDLAIVALFYGTQVPADTSLPSDVNGDSVVNVLDLTAVAHGIDTVSGGNGLSLQAVEAALEAAAAQAAELEEIAEAPMRFGRFQNVADALADVKHLSDGDVRLGSGVTVLEELLQLFSETVAIPERTALLPNYPNPFNPETWIPYHLAKAVNVTLTIYDMRGVAVRQLMLGHQAAGVYESRARAAYWDGKNALGESVASDVYFYTLTAGDFTATRKLLIVK